MDNRSIIDSYRENHVNIRHKKKIAAGLAAVACLTVFITGIVIASTAKGYPIPDDDTIIKHMVDLAKRAHCSITNIEDAPGPAGHFRSFTLECSGSEAERLINNNKANNAIKDYLSDALEPGMTPMEIVGLVLSTGGWLAATCAGGLGAMLAIVLIQFLLTMVKMAMPSVHEGIRSGVNNVAHVVTSMATNSYQTTRELIARMGGYHPQIDQVTPSSDAATSTAGSESGVPGELAITINPETPMPPVSGPTTEATDTPPLKLSTT